jgi:murein DD-endopeptidase MepM/ murein hydrolase activator NlpD
LDLKSKIKDWLDTKFLFVIRKEEDFSVVTSFNVTKAKIVSIGSLLVILSLVSSLILTKTLLKKWFDPEYIASENVDKIAELTAKIDSLTNYQAYEQSYLHNIRKIILGEDEYLSDFEDSINNENPTISKDINFEFADATKSILGEFDNAPLDFGNTGLVSGKFFEGYFFTPVKGVVVSSFSPQKNQLGVKIKVQENEAVKVIADGTVFFSSWTPDYGYVVAIQHANDLISVYKENAVVLKKFGDYVRAGEIISIFGSNRDKSYENHLQFELWYKMSPLNPEEFILFN